MTPGSRPIVFLYPGRLETPTGGYVYDRQLLRALEDIGIAVEAHSLGEGYPAPSEETLAEADALLSGLADGTRVVIDGLAYGVLDAAASRHGKRLALVALVHHPLAHESGLSTDRMAELTARERAALAHARQVITTSAATASTLTREFAVPPERIGVVEPALSIPPQEPDLNRNAASGVSPSVRLLAVGSLIRRKDYPTLLAALARMTDLDWHLDIAGSRDADPDHAGEICRRIEDLGLGGRITVHGALPEEAVSSLYRAADIFVLTTLYEGYGMAFAEAMAHGLPVIATGEGAVATTVPACAGLVLPAGAVEAVADALRRLIVDPEQRRTLAEGARRHALSLPTWADQARTFAKLLEGLSE
ncbi:glycosyltransferase family 4 protein [Stappia taiwanensis]|uniref:Glycosyltransferase family 4 protein n=1 Tax=Stappia taiwanensis TaxID=992267 RepID=A0A838Y006_9HYPH|nr:glycosyltransferase family 4 protein [Stappia taiwanensis]MBA4612584.1 glycosyltransferase family 4 protein [Stappia taiwanensis]GGE89309.1 glycosyl transferase family 1 [Stappia taiwanensis]